jgi:hypothetical protein
MSAKRYAVLIGSSTFPHDETLLALACPPHDVDGLNEVLASEEFGGFSEIHVLKDRPHYEVLRRINQTLKKAEKDDLVLIYFSGHGKLDGAGRLHLATSDTEVADLESTSVPVQSIRNFVDVSPSTKTALILDCCYSGAVGEAFFRGGIDDQLNLASSGRGTFIMTASTAIQVAKEKEGDRYGIFTKHLIDGIKGGAADLDGDGYVTMGELYTYVHDEVLKESHQEPMKWDLNVRGELIIAKSGTAPWENKRTLIRKRLLELAGQGVLPDSILTQALEVASLKRSELNDHRRPYSDLLAELIETDTRLGEFIDNWLEIAKSAGQPPPHEVTERKVPDAPELEPPKPEAIGTRQVKPQMPLWGSAGRAEPLQAAAAAPMGDKPLATSAGAGERSGATHQAAVPATVLVATFIAVAAILGFLGAPDAVILIAAAVVSAVLSGSVLWVRQARESRETALAVLLWLVMTALLLGATIVATEGADDPSPIILMSVIGMAIGIGIWLSRRHRQTAVSLAVHWVGWSIQAAAFGSTAVFDWAEDAIFWVALFLAALPSGAFLLYWWQKVRPKSARAGRV